MTTEDRARAHGRAVVDAWLARAPWFVPGPRSAWFGNWDNMRTSLARELHDVGVDEIDRLATLAFDAAHHHWGAIGDPNRTRPRIITDHGNTGDSRARHMALIVLWPGQPEARRYCADSWCDGRCGMPALVITTPSGDAGATVTLKAHGDHVACGNPTPEQTGGTLTSAVPNDPTEAAHMTPEDLASRVSILATDAQHSAEEADLHTEAGQALTRPYLARVRKLLAWSHSTVAMLRALSVVTAEEGDPLGAAMLSDFASLYVPVEHAGR